MLRVLVIFSIIFFANSVKVPRNNSAVLITKYAKVAKWGANDRNNFNTSQGSQRSFRVNGSPRFNSDSSSSNQIIHHYPVYQKASDKSSDDDVEIVPGIGEVIQDRFQVRPYFGFNKPNDSAKTYLPPTQPQATPAPAPVRPPAPPIVQPTPQISPPILPASDFNAPAPSPAPPSNLYNSPFTSYNPPPSSNSNTDQDVYPPNAPPTSDGSDSFSSSDNGDSYSAPPLSNDGPYDSQPAPKPVEMSNHINMNSYLPPSNNYGPPNHAPSAPMHSGPPNHPPKSISDIYYPPDFPKDQISQGYGSPMIDTPPNGDHAHNDDHKDDSMDLNPPSQSQDFPKYLYDDHHYDDHHVYVEVPHATTAAPEKKRVSTTNFSYYYLGRKLWYIPLYFSIYFMVYVTALIIKSIARHKVTLRNQYITANSRSARQVTMDHVNAIDEIHQNITTAIDKAEKMYSKMYM